MWTAETDDDKNWDRLNAIIEAVAEGGTEENTVIMVEGK